MAKRGFIETPFKEAYPASSGSSDFEGSKQVSGDLDVSGAKPVIGTKIGDAPEDLFDCLDHYTSQS